MVQIQQDANDFVKMHKEMEEQNIDDRKKMLEDIELRNLQAL